MSPLTEEQDYSAAITDTFAKFQQGTVTSSLVKYVDLIEMNHVEEGILGLVAEIFPNQFDALRRFAQQHAAFSSAILVQFDREAQFYLGYDEYLAHAAGDSIPTCLPTVTADRTTSAVGAVDVVLAAKLAGGTKGIVGNDFSLTGEQRILVVIGAKQGGKTTFARAFGQLHYLAALGLPVAASEAALHLFDQIFTQFERQEDLQNLADKLETT